MEKEIERILSAADLSPHTYEIVSRIHEGGRAPVTS